jgi:hypothetical protein
VIYDEQTRQTSLTTVFNMEMHKRRPLRPKSLHPYSQRFHDLLLQHRPDWLAHGFNVLGYTHKLFDLEVELPHPSGGREIGRYRRLPEPLVLWMNSGEELSCTWGPAHWHTRGVNVPDDADGFQWMLRQIENVLSERAVRVDCIGTIKHTAILFDIANEDTEAAARELGKGAVEVHVCSWLATRDQRLRIQP